MREYVSANNSDSYEDAVEKINDELTSVVDLCKQRGYSPKEIEKTAKHFYRDIRYSNVKLWLTRIAKIGIFLAVLVLIVQWRPVKRLYSTCSRRLFISLIPYWNWTPMFDKRCLFENPSYKGFDLTEADCELCEGLGNLKRVNNTNMIEISQRFLKRDIPVIVEDGLRDWGSLSNMNISHMAEIFLKHPILRQYPSCEFVSNMRTKYRSDHRAFLRRVKREDVSEYYAYWENCEKEAARAFREFFKRPYFLPPMVQLSDTNWVYVSSMFKGKKRKEITIYRQMNMIIQIKGEIDIFIQPRGVCEYSCDELSGTLKEGEILLTTDFLWDLKYFPGLVEESVGIGIGGRFD